MARGRTRVMGQLSAQRAEGGTQLFGKQLRLLPRGEVAAAARLMEVVERRVRLPGPAFRRAIDLTGEHRDGDGHLDRRGALRLGAEIVVVVFPVEARGRRPRVRHPVQGDVVQYTVA